MFLFFAVFSRYVRPFGTESLYNAKLWTRGGYSIRTGKVAPGFVAFESTPVGKEAVAEIVEDWFLRG